MIKFFRKIRQKLLSENKFSKYLFYAIGEILLVVIGILIALQINNWNEEQKDLAKEELILKQLQSEYQSNLAQLDEKIMMRNDALHASNYLLDQIDKANIVDEDRIYRSLWQIMRDPTFDPIKNDIIGSDKQRLIVNDTLVRALSIWSDEAYQVQEMELEFQKYRTEIMYPCYIRLGVFRNINDNLWEDGYIPANVEDKETASPFLIRQSKRKVDLNDIFQDAELEGIITGVITIQQITNRQSENLRERIVNMLELIEKELNK